MQPNIQMLKSYIYKKAEYMLELQLVTISLTLVTEALSRAHIAMTLNIVDAGTCTQNKKTWTAIEILLSIIIFMISIICFRWNI